MAAAGISAIAPLRFVRAVASFLKCQLRDGAIFDGEAGRRISRARYLATLAAYRTSYRLIKAQSKDNI